MRQAILSLSILALVLARLLVSAFLPRTTRRPRGPQRVVYFGGPGDIWGAMRVLERGEKDTTLGTVGYSELFVRACVRADVDQLLILTTHQGGEREHYVVDGMPVIVQHYKDQLTGKGGWRFHLACFVTTLSLRKVIVAFRPDVIFTSQEIPRLLAYELLRPNGCELVHTQHCGYASTLLPRKLAQRVLMWLDGLAMGKRFAAILSVSRDVTAQLREYFHRTPVAELLPFFDRDLHQAAPSMPAIDGGELRALFVGRIERAKGVFDLLETARLLRDRGAPVSFDVCGDGAMLSELRAQVAVLELGATFRLHGWCDRAKMQALAARAHVGVIPTRAEFNEGFNQSAVEVLLSGRPVVTSRAIPATAYIERAVKLAVHDSPRSYADALELLAAAPELLHERAAHCASETAKFFDESTSYSAAVAHVLRALWAGVAVPERTIGLDGTVRTQLAPSCSREFEAATA